MKIRSVAIRGIALAACGAGVLAGAWTAVPGVASASAVTAPVKAVAPKVTSGKTSGTIAPRKAAADLPSIGGNQDEICSQGNYGSYLAEIDDYNRVIEITSVVPSGECAIFGEAYGTVSEDIMGVDSNGNTFYIGYEGLPGGDCIYTTGTTSSHNWYATSC